MNEQPFYLISYTSDLASLPLHNKEDNGAGCKVTVVIGPNGSGKSTVVANLVDELDRIHWLIYQSVNKTSSTRAARQTEATIEYRLGQHLYRIERKGLELTAFRDGEKVEPSGIPLPSRVLAVAHLPTDKFRFSRNDDSKFYWYLGLRQATNLATTGALEAKVISSLLTGLRSSQYRRALGEWLDVLQIEDDFQIELRHLRRDAFQIANFSDLERSKGSARTGLFSAKKELERSANRRIASITEQGISQFFSRLAALAEPVALAEVGLKSRSKSTFLLPFNALEEEMPQVNVSWDTGIGLIRKFRIAEEVNLIVKKNGRRTSFADLSSGERQIFGTVTQLFEYATNGCVIAIDEPEVSLHPSWQIRYIPTLLKALSHIKSAHVIVATHSHFLVSDVENGMASLVVARSDHKNKWGFDAFDGDVHGRTPENILYRVFGVGTGSNFYVEQDLANALHMISGVQNFDINELHRIRNRLDRIAEDDNPALQEILRMIDDRLEGASNA